MDRGMPEWTPPYRARRPSAAPPEPGHAFRGGSNPGGWGPNTPPQTGGLHESFGARAAVFLALPQLDQAEPLMAITKADPPQKNFLAALAEPFGAALGRS